MTSLRMLLPAAIVAALLISAMPSSASAQSSLRVVTTTEDLAAIAREVGGSRVQVDAICRGVEDPHAIQARPSYMVKLSRADLLIAVGLELEVGWLPSLIQGARNPKIRPGSAGYLDASSAIRPIEIAHGSVDRSAGDVHRLGNPHYWLDPQNGKLIAKKLAQKLSAIDPSGAADYTQRLSAFEKRIDAAMAHWQKALAPYRGAKVVTYHKTFNYFLQRYGLVGLDTIETRPGIPPTASHLASLIGTMRSQRVRVILHETFYDRATSELVARKSGAQLLVLPSSVGGVSSVRSYEQLIDYLVAQLQKALAAAS